MRFFIAFAALFSVSSAAAAADWAEATTDHFVVYSETSAQEAAKLAVELERFDEAMRYMFGIGKDKEIPDSSKLTVYQFGDTDDIGRLAGSRGVAGFFIPRAGNSVAFVPAKESRDRGGIGTRTEGAGLESGVVMFHEYAHYFMFQHAAAAYPAWYREGFAEVYGTLELTPKGFRMGAPATHRADVLRYLNTYNVERMLDPPEKINREDVAQIYAMGWMMSHYLTFSGERKGQLDEYLKLINSGKNSLDAATGAFGDLGQLNRDLDKYRRGRAQGLEISYNDYTTPVAKVRELTEAEEAIIMLHIQSMRGVDEDKAGRLVGPVREVAAKYPDSVPVLLQLAEAEFDAKNDANAEAAARRVLAIDQSNAKAHIYLARVAMRRAKDDKAQFEIARQEFAAANRLDSLNPDPLLGYYLSYKLAGETPPEQALIALETSYDYAPFDAKIRTTLAHLLLSEDRDAEAVRLLGPIINDPHAGKKAKKMRELVKKVQAGDKTGAMAELAPKIDEKDEEDEEDTIRR